jgi:hypothetical protein
VTFSVSVDVLADLANVQNSGRTDLIGEPDNHHLPLQIIYHVHVGKRLCKAVQQTGRFKVDSPSPLSSLIRYYFRVVCTRLSRKLHCNVRDDIH